MPFTVLLEFRDGMIGLQEQIFINKKSNEEFSVKKKEAIFGPFQFEFSRKEKKDE